MTGELDEFSRLLQQENRALREADVGRLVELQQQKRAALDAMKDRGVDVPDEVAEAARCNVALMRHLVQCLRGMSAQDPEVTYNAAGQRSPHPEGTSRGAL